jgi:hypothetical protein
VVEGEAGEAAGRVANTGQAAAAVVADVAEPADDQHVPAAGELFRQVIADHPRAGVEAFGRDEPRMEDLGLAQQDDRYPLVEDPVRKRVREVHGDDGFELLRSELGHDLSEFDFGRLDGVAVEWNERHRPLLGGVVDGLPHLDPERIARFDVDADAERT